MGQSGWLPPDVSIGEWSFRATFIRISDWSQI